MSDASIPTPEVSIIIVGNRPSAYLEQALDAIRRSEWPGWEVVVVLDAPHSDGDPRVRFIASGPVGPADKRDLGAAAARAGLLAFLDDDAYPAPDWLAAVVQHFEDSSVVAVGGPGVTPPDDGFWQQVSGWVYASWAGSAGLRYRYVQGRRRDVDDYPSMNLTVRQSAFAAAGGFDSEFYPGEDTKLCLALTAQGGRIVYEPAALVYHHRRALVPGHLRQVAAYGRHRGYFARRLPETSLRPYYFIPSIWTVWLGLGALLLREPGAPRTLYLLSLALYGLVLGATALDVTRRSRDPLLGLAVLPALVATHLVYGIEFIRGILAPRP